MTDEVAGPAAAGDRRFAQVIVDGVVDPVLVLSTDGTVLHANPAARRVFGRTMVGEPFGVPSDDEVTSEVDLLTPQGTRTAEMRIGRAGLDGEEVLVATLRDVTERKRFTERLREFVSHASHEFRSPLFAISGFSETLSAEWEQLDETARQRYLDIMRRQSKRLVRLSVDLLELSRLDDPERVQPRTRAVPLRDVLDTVTDAVAHDVAVTGADVVVRADAGHLEDVLTNLLVNAQKYGAPPLEVAAVTEGDAVAIRVTDHGPGVPADFRPTMYDAFARAGRRRAGDGAGLGLAIARGLVERNGGRVAYEDTPGGGATFVVTLPPG